MEKNNQDVSICFTYDSSITSSAELIAPGINLNQPELAVQALRIGMGKVETKDCIDAVTGGETKFPVENATAIAETVLKGAAAVLKERRAKNNRAQAMAQIKTQDSKQGDRQEIYSDDYLNNMYADFWKDRV